MSETISRPHYAYSSETADTYASVLEVSYVASAWALPSIASELLLRGVFI